MRRWITLGLAVLVVGLTIGFLFVDLDDRGILNPPPPIGPRNDPLSSWMERLAASRSGGGTAVRSRWPSTTEGLQQAIQSRADLIGACHRAWVHGDSSAPRQATARIRITAGTDGLGHVTGVDIDVHAGGVQTMQGCVTQALAPLVFDRVPPTGLVVLWTLNLPDAP